MIKITNVSADAVKRLNESFNMFHGLSIIEEFDEFGEEICSVVLPERGIVKLYNLSSSLSIDIGGHIEILEEIEFRELRFC